MKTVIVTAVQMKNFRFAVMALVLLVAPYGLAACSSGDRPAVTAAGDCPTDPVPVVVSVDQWGDIVGQLGGSCAKVTTLLAGSGVDPHDFEPSPADAAKVSGAKLVVVNGGHYDEWANKLAASSAPQAPVVSAVDLRGGNQIGEGNPHVWYDPATVVKVADAVTKKLTELAPEATDYFAARRSEFTEALKPYQQAIATIADHAKGRTYAATESVFDDMAAAVGLIDRTPAGFAAAAAHESDPSPADQAAFLKLLSDHGVDVLIYNTQTEGSVPQQIRTAAENASVPVVEVTETVAPGSKSFQDWQLNQLKALAGALGVTL
ncbi:ABC transporter substrate-binding protein [Mycolicibacterium insubricum]|uniref:ABC transporter substrate-binding protein n=2 Tax=Mycolicibacterium insubricum TaxID=444597 RepID=A0A1X0D5F3_9MYCO|nr:ABC transporter substrate-binding protein [Mycolicibacterium insubricum]BBZ64651.1 ABC transporter substrate-binding protein [Mycolicibacterium insubricum]